MFLLRPLHHQPCHRLRQQQDEHNVAGVQHGLAPVEQAERAAGQYAVQPVAEKSASQPGGQSEKTTFVLSFVGFVRAYGKRKGGTRVPNEQLSVI